MSTKIPEDVKNRLSRFPHINWSEVMREAIIKRIEEEEAKLITRNKEDIKEAIIMMDKLRRECQTNSTEELRKWRDIRH